MKFNSELQQLRDMKEGILLIPVEQESARGGIVVQGNPEMQRIREKNNAIRQAASRDYTFSKVLYYYEENLDSIIQSPRPERYILTHHLQEYGQVIGLKELFVASHHKGNDPLPNEVRMVDHRKRKKQHQEEAPLFASTLQRRQWLEAEIVKVEASLDSANAANDLEKIKANSKRLSDLKNQLKNNEFDRKFDYYSSSNPGYDSMLIRRVQPTPYNWKKKKTYYFNYNYLSRLHDNTDTKTRYQQALATIDRQLTNRLSELEKKFATKEKLKNVR